jgi:hypothetical protein
MLEKELPLGIVQFMWSMWCKTLVFCVRGAKCITLSGYKGLRKDSILSPLLYNLLGSGIDRLVPSGSDSLKYADDILSDRKHLWFPVSIWIGGRVFFGVLPQMVSFKYLGVIFDAGIRWETQTRYA